jgi:glyoxylase-like metal-dependent hydrolase (beta-lactamase superfamily II)
MNLNQAWYDVREVAPRTWAISDHGLDAFFYVSGESSALLIDTGFGFGDLKAMARELDDKPLHLVLTHGHPDHGNGAWQFNEVFLGREESDTLHDYCSAQVRACMVDEILDRHDAETARLIGEGFDRKRWAAAPLPPVKPVEAGYIFDLGGRKLEVVPLPGHTPGSIGLLDRDKRLLFSGDAVHSGQIWLQMPESSTLAEFHRMLVGLAPQRAAFDWLLWGHSQDPAPAALIDDLITGVADLLAGRRKGEPHSWSGGEGLLIDFGSCSLFYREGR